MKKAACVLLHGEDQCAKRHFCNHGNRCQGFCCFGAFPKGHGKGGTGCLEGWVFWLVLTLAAWCLDGGGQGLLDGVFKRARVSGAGGGVPRVPDAPGLWLLPGNANWHRESCQDRG